MNQGPPETRPAAVAGSFYPAEPEALRAAVVALLAAVPSGPQGPPPKALIVPHAGYVYSGPIAASAYTRLLPGAERIRRIVLLGPCHRVAVRGLAAPYASAFATPLGPVAIDQAIIDTLMDLPQVHRDDAAHAAEHSLEVQLPFLRRVAPNASLVPLAVGDASAGEVAEVLDRLWGGPETRILISSDLSHYLPYAAARQVDAATAQAIELLDGTRLTGMMACGCVPIAGLLAAARQRGLAIERLDLRNSGDTSGPRDQVVGYGAWALSELQ